ncbi:MAG TPA: extracellular solute-binding protein [Chloroflexota bacterium]|jgi:multiple sugar transport system substrate-binding protein|nr:extracellular solute-binding protein [Chloroflexota bacterium]
MHAVRLSRRTLLSLVVSSSVGLLAACGGAATATTGTTTAAPASATSAAASVAAATSASPTASAATQSAVSTAATTVATASGAASVTASAATAKPAAQGLTLEFWNEANDQPELSVIQDLVAKFNKQEPDFQVKNAPVASGTNYEKYTAAMAGGAPPDAFMTYSWTPVPGWAYQGAILPLDPYMAQMKINKDDYFPIVWSMVYLHGHLWGFLQEFDSSALALNRSIFNKYGLDPTKPPTTIAELDDLNAKLTQHDSSGAITQLGLVPAAPQGGNITPWLAAFGGMYFDTIKGQFTIYRPENIAALDWVAGWWKKAGGRAAINDFNKKNSSTSNSHVNTFTLEKQGLMVMREYQPIQYKKEFPNLDWANAFLPVQPPTFAGTSVADGANVFVVAKGIAHPEQSITFVKWMGGPAATLEWCGGANNVPPVKAAALGADFAQQAPLMKVWLDAIALSKDENHLVGAITHPAFQEFSKLSGPIQNDILDGKVSADAGLQQLQQLMQPVLAKYPGW